MTTYEAAKQYHDAGLNVIPIKTDGSKAPVIRWEHYVQTKAVWAHTCPHWTSKGAPAGIGVVCGATSGDVEVIDFDDGGCFPFWELDIGYRLGRTFLNAIPQVMTPKGSGRRHLYYRSSAVAPGVKLAEVEVVEDGRAVVRTRIETRGQGNYVIAPGSPNAVHPTGLPYRVGHGSLLEIPVVTADQRAVMLECARKFHLVKTKPTIARPFTMRRAADPSHGERPGEHFQRTATWEDVLCPHGWTLLKTRNGVGYWRKPDSHGHEHHATTNYGDSGLFIVFTTSTLFEVKKGYGKFAAYCILNHQGDFADAAKELSRLGYGNQAETDYQTLIDQLFS